MVPTGLSKTSVTNYQSTLGKFPEDRRFKYRMTSNEIHMGRNDTGTGFSIFFGFPRLIIIPPLLLIAMTYMVSPHQVSRSDPKPGCLQSKIVNVIA
jgi:hypothetical protein